MTLQFGVFDHIEPVRGLCSFQWGDLTHEHAMRSIELFTAEVMPGYTPRSAAARAHPAPDAR